MILKDFNLLGQVPMRIKLTKAQQENIDEGMVGMRRPAETAHVGILQGQASKDQSRPLSDNFDMTDQKEDRNRTR